MEEVEEEGVVVQGKELVDQEVLEEQGLYEVFEVGQMTEWSKDFSVEEFRCKCGCGSFAKRDKLVDGLQKIRDKLGKPIIVNSGTRCNAHNRDVGGSDTSSHLDGLAADISCEDMFTLLKYCLQVFKRVGVGPGYVHVDIDDKKPQGIYWVYGDNGKRVG